MALCNIDGTVNIAGLWKNGSSYDWRTRAKRILSGRDKIKVSDVNELRQYVEQIRTTTEKDTSTREGNRQAAGMLVGSVNAGGQVVVNPDNWSCKQAGSGRYKLTHNLGTYGYHIFVTVYTVAEPKGERMGNVYNRNENDVIIAVQNDEGKDRWNYFDVTLVKL